MPFLQTATDSIPDQVLIDPGEYVFEVKKATVKTTSSGGQMIFLVLQPQGVQDAEAVFTNLVLPGPKYEEQAQRMMNLRIKEFYQAFGWTEDGFSYDDSPDKVDEEKGVLGEITAFKGLTGLGVVKKDEYQGRETRTISMFKPSTAPGSSGGGLA